MIFIKNLLYKLVISLINKWPLAQNLSNLLITCTNLARRDSFFSKNAFGKFGKTHELVSGEFGKFG
jgi:hypothetical protein